MKNINKKSITVGELREILSDYDDEVLVLFVPNYDFYINPDEYFFIDSCAYYEKPVVKDDGLQFYLSQRY